MRTAKSRPRAARRCRSKFLSRADPELHTAYATSSLELQCKGSNLGPAFRRIPSLEVHLKAANVSANSYKEVNLVLLEKNIAGSVTPFSYGRQWTRSSCRTCTLPVKDLVTPQQARARSRAENVRPMDPGRTSCSSKCYSRCWPEVAIGNKQEQARGAGGAGAGLDEAASR